MTDTVVMLVEQGTRLESMVRPLVTSQADIQLHVCPDTAKASEMALEIRPTVILLYGVRKDGAGLRAVSTLRANPDLIPVPIIVLWPQDEPLDRDGIYSRGAVGHVIMPAHRLELVAALRAHSRSYVAQRQRDDTTRELGSLKMQLDQSHTLVEQLATMDCLTGLANRRRFDEALEVEWRRAKRNGSNVSLLLCDLDQFSRFNRTYGPQRGDDCLREVAHAMQNGIKRASDTLARYGADEFVALLPETPCAGAIVVARDLRTRVANLRLSHVQNAPGSHITVSQGIATMRPGDGGDFNILLAMTLTTLQAAKREGPNTLKTHPLSV